MTEMTMNLSNELKKLRDREDKLRRSSINRSVIFVEDDEGNKRFEDFNSLEGPHKIHFENLRVSDPISPKNGQSWIRIDLIP